MPYRKRRRKKKGAYAIAKKALKKVNRISRGIESKHLTVNAAEANVDDDGTFTADLNIPVQGLLDSNRIGDAIFCTGVHIRMNYTAGANDLSTQLRVILIWDKYNTVGSDDLLISRGTNQAPLSMYNVDTRKDWIKLMDKNVILTSPDGSSFRQMNKFFRLNKETKFLAAGQTITKGRLVLFYISNIDSGGTDADKPNVLCQSRVFYSDL